MRLADNWLVRNTALAVVEVIRNTPQLLQIIFWYVAVLQTLPPPRAGLNLPGGAILSVRGLNLPSLHFGGGALLMGHWPGGISVICAMALATRPRPPTHLRLAALLLPMGWLALLALSISSIEFPVLRGFNYSGGIVVPPELLAVVAGLSL